MHPDEQAPGLDPASTNGGEQAPGDKGWRDDERIPRAMHRADADNWRTGGLYVVRAVVAFGWATFPEDATRWRFRHA